MRSLRQRRCRCSCFAASAQPIKYEPIDVKLIVLQLQQQQQQQLLLQLQRLVVFRLCFIKYNSSRAHKVQTLSSTLRESQHVLLRLRLDSLPAWLPFSSLIAHFTRCQLCEQCHKILFSWHILRGSEECAHWLARIRNSLMPQIGLSACACLPACLASTCSIELRYVLCTSADAKAAALINVPTWGQTKGPSIIAAICTVARESEGGEERKGLDDSFMRCTRIVGKFDCSRSHYN